jgi:hypothetical protein
MLSFEENVRTILQCCFSQSKDEIIENAVKCIVALKCEPIVVNPALNPIDPEFYQSFPPITTTPAEVPITTPVITCTASAEDLKKLQNPNIINKEK